MEKGAESLKKDFIRRDLKNIPRDEENRLVEAIIKIAYIISNSGIIVGEKLEMPNSILSSIREISCRASGMANSKKFINRNLDRIFPYERDSLAKSIKEIARIINNKSINVAAKLEIPDKFLKQQP